MAVHVWNCWKQQDMTKNGYDDWKWLKMAGMAGIAGRGSNWLEWFEVSGNGLTRQEMA